ncbi:hypothetical protein RB195_021591 [Necator americanus]|uniref:STAS domain-containing protein n=1 Tax=Necator americanus TaxID=51031 RepID=A0ABR1ECG6_NECAM
MNQKEFDEKNGFTTPLHHNVTDFLKRASRKIIRMFCTIEDYPSIYNVPQGMAYSVLATLPAVYGLYASFLPPLFYFLFGTSRHISVGVFSLTCLMVGQARLSILPDYTNGTHATEYKGINDLAPIDVVIVLGFVTGIVQIFMWILQLSFLSAYLSDSVVSGLTFGAVLHALIAQFPNLIGIKLESVETDGFLHILTKLKAIFIAVPRANLITLALSASTILFLVIFKRFVEPCFRRCKIPLPSELVALILATIISNIGHLQDRYNIKIVNHVPVGFPTPKIPRFELIPDLLGHAISIAIVSYAVTVSMGKLFARKHKYQIDTNQEMLALGFANCFSSFFSVFPTSTSLSRSMVNEGAGARTQVSGFVSAIAILGVILFVGPVLEQLPICILSSIVTVALSSLLAKLLEIPVLWKFSKSDVVAWVGTAFVTFCWDIIEGLVCGMLISLMTVVLQTQRPNVTLLGKVGDSEYRSLDNYTSATPTKVPVIKFDAPVIFTNAELFKNHIRSLLKIEQGDDNGNMLPMDDTIWMAIVLDCSSWTYTDAMGVNAIKEINDELLKKKFLLIFANLKSDIRIQYARAGLFKTLQEDQFCPTVNDALAVASILQSNSYSFFPAKNYDKIRVV